METAVKGRKRAGRPPKGAVRGKTASFTARITPALRTALDAEADETGRSLADVIEDRIRDSYDQKNDAKRIVEALGGEKNFRFFQLFAIFIQSVEASASGKHGADRESWLTNPWVFDQVANNIPIILRDLRDRLSLGAPKRPSRPGDDPEKIDMLGEMFARTLDAQLDFINQDEVRVGNDMAHNEKLIAMGKIKQALSTRRTKAQ
jgi:hypothetical protein